MPTITSQLYSHSSRDWASKLNSYLEIQLFQYLWTTEPQKKSMPQLLETNLEPAWEDSFLVVLPKTQKLALLQIFALRHTSSVMLYCGMLSIALTSASLI